jgi:DNA-binding MarR family transcriptional regulator
MQLRAYLDRVSTSVLKKKMGFGVSQFRILYVLAHKPEMTQKVIADFWDVTEASVSRQVGILVRHGLVMKSQNHQGAAITPKGKKVLALAMKHASAGFEKVFKDFSDADRERTAKLLEKLMGTIKKHARFT